MRKKIVAICTGIVVVAGTVTLVVFNNKKTNANEKNTIIETMTEQETTTQIETTTEKESTTKEETTEVETTSEESKEQVTQEQAEQQNIEALDKTMYVTSTANVRSGADTGTSLVGQLYGGMSVHVTGVTGEWYEIEFNNSKAYVHNSLLSDTATVYQEPETQAPQQQQQPVYQEPETQAPAPQPVYTEPETQATNDDLDNYQPYEYKDGDTAYGTTVDLSPAPSLEEFASFTGHDNIQ